MVAGVGAPVAVIVVEKTGPCTVASTQLFEVGAAVVQYYCSST